MRLAFTLALSSTVSQRPFSSRLSSLEVHQFCHHPALWPKAQLPPGQPSLSLFRVLNIIPFEPYGGHCTSAIASPASPLYPATVSRYLPTSSLTENVEYSADFQLPLVRFTYRQQYSINLSAESRHRPTMAKDCQLLTDIGRRSLRSADVLTCATIRTWTRLGDRSFSVAGPCLWNSLPVALNPVYTMQPVVQPVVQPAASCKHSCSRLYNRLHRVYAALRDRHLTCTV